MIISAKLKNFRRHEDLTVNFTSGLNAIRGANEAGKTTLIEAVLYALYGAKSLRDTLAETVTWGCKESSLSVSIVIKVRDSMYTFTRSKNGAEAKGDDGTHVTGQNEVSAFAAELLGADAKVASLLMLASQSGLRGALDDGPAAVSGLMAKLADFDILDKIMEAATQKLSLGSVVPFQQKVTESEEELQKARSSLPDPEIESKLVADIGAIGETIKAHQALEDQLQLAVADASGAVDKAEAANRDRAVAASRVSDLERRMVVEDGKRKAAMVDITKAPGKAVLDSLREDARLEADNVKELGKYKAFQKLKYPEVFWTGTYESFLAEIKGLEEGLKSKEELVFEMRRRIAAAEAGWMKDGKCPACGRADHTPEEVQAHNDKITAAVATDKALLPAQLTAIKEAKAYMVDLAGVEEAARTFQRSLAPIGDRVLLDLGFYPPKATWNGPVPTEVQGTVAATKLRDAEALQRAADMAQGRYDAAVAAANSLEQELAQAKAKLDGMVQIDLEPLKVAYDAAYAKYAENAAKLRELISQRDALAVELRNHQRSLADRLSTIKVHEDRIKELTALVKATEFNNGLMLKLKKIKPAITDHLWNTVLAAVGTFFTSMRGEQSLVTKDKDGFKVNGRSIESLSGSTLDALALAVRVALTRTFIPHSSFIVLDEPAHGCDNDRTGNVLGFLASAGFPQTILASHDDMSEAVADNVVAI